MLNMSVNNNAENNACNSNPGTNLNVLSGVCSEEAVNLLKMFYACENPFAPEPRNKENRLNKIKQLE